MSGRNLGAQGRVSGGKGRDQNLGVWPECNSGVGRGVRGVATRSRTGPVGGGAREVKRVQQLDLGEMGGA